MADDRETIESGPAGERQNGVMPSGHQAGVGPSAADRDPSGGSSGTGGYGRAQNQELSGQRDAAADEGGDETLAEDQAAHQDRGQSQVEEAEGSR